MGAGWYCEVVYLDYIVDRRSRSSRSSSWTRSSTASATPASVRASSARSAPSAGQITPAQERVFRAAGRAHVRTGIPILTHTTHWGELALEQLDLLAEEGVDPGVVIVSHLGDRHGIDIILPIAERGAWINVDNIGFVSGYAPLEFRADNVAELAPRPCRAGDAQQRHLRSSDSSPRTAVPATRT